MVLDLIGLIYCPDTDERQEPKLHDKSRADFLHIAEDNTQILVPLCYPHEPIHNSFSTLTLVEKYSPSDLTRKKNLVKGNEVKKMILENFRVEKGPNVWKNSGRSADGIRIRERLKWTTRRKCIATIPGRNRDLD